MNWMSDSELWVKPTYEHIETNLSMLQILLDNGADVSQAEWENMGILHVEAWRNYERLMRTLLAAGGQSFHQGCQGTYSSILGSSNVTSQDGKDAAIGGGRGYSKTTEGKGVEVTARSTTIRRWATSESSQPGKRGQDTACLRLACPAIKRHQQRVRRALGTQIGISLLDCPVI